YGLRGIAYTEVGQWDKAVNDLSLAIKVDSSNFNAYFYRAHSYENLGRVGEAIADYTTLTRMQITDARPFICLGIIQSAKGNLSAAIEITLYGLSRFPENETLNVNAGYFIMENGDYDKSIEYLQRSLNTGKNSFDALMGLALDYYYKQDLGKSRSYLERASVYEPRLKKGMDGIADLEMAGFAYSKKDKETLKKMFEEFK
ncbi:MAG: tetratricopeptide repeat protein, partial [Bacteroidota bacterium]